MKAVSKSNNFSFALTDIPFPAVVHRVDNGVVMQLNSEGKKFFRLKSTKKNLTLSTLWSGTPPDASVGRAKTFTRFGPIVHHASTGKDTTVFLLRKRIQLHGMDCLLDYLELPSSLQHEDALQQTQQTLNRSQSIASIGSWEMYGNFNEIRWSDEFYRLHGLAPQSVKPSTRLRLSMVHPKDRAKMQKAIDDAVRLGKPYALEKRIVRPDGTVRWVLSQGEATLDEHTGKRKIFGTLLDITARKETEEIQHKLTQSLADFQDAIENTAVVSRTDNTGRIMDVNANFVGLCGYSQKELVGNHYGVINSGHHSRVFWADLWRTLNAGKTWRGEIKNKAKDGTFFWVDATIIPVRDGTGTTTEFFAIEHDITARKESHDALFLSYSSLRETLLFAKMGSAELDLKTFQLSMSRELLELLDIDSTKPIVIPFAQFIAQYVHPDFQAVIGEKVKEGMADPAAVKTEVNVSFAMITATAREIWMEARGIFKGTTALGILQDATDRKRAEQTLQESSQRVISLADNIPDGLIYEYWTNMARTEAGFTYASQGVEKVFELTADELIHDVGVGLGLVHPDDLAAVKEATNISIATLKGLDVDYRINVRSGKQKWVKTKATPHLRPDGTVHFIAICIDITRQKKLEAEQATNRFKLQNTLDNLISAVVVASPDGKITYANKSALYILDTTADEVTEHYFHNPVWKPVDETGQRLAPENLPLSIALTKQQAVGNVLHGLQHENGSMKWISVNAAPLLDEAGRMYAAVSSFIDITESRAAELNREKSENELRAIIEASAYATVLLDPQGVVQNFNAFASRNATFILNHALEKGNHFLTVIPPLFQADFSTNFARALQGEKVLVEREIQNVNQHKLWLEFLYLPVFNKAMEVTGVTFNVTDLTQKKEAEAHSRKRTEQIRFAARLARFGEWELDLATHQCRWSDEVCRIHDVAPGYSPGLEEALSFYTADSKVLLRHAIQKCIDDGDWYDMTLQIVSKAGKKKWIRTVGVSERINNRAVKLYGLFQDIDDVRQKEEESARLALIAKRTDNLVVITDADRKIQWVNESFTRTTGYTSREVIGRTTEDFLYGPETLAETVTMVHEKLARKEPVKFEIVHYKRSGETHWLDVEIQPVFGASGELDYFIEIQSNVTERKQAEENLQLTQLGLQKSLQEKESLIKEIHHRVKNNLQLISSILYLKMSGMHQSDMKDFLEDTRHKIRSIALIHERLLQSGSMHQVDIADYLSKLILDLQMTVMTQTLDLSINAHIEPTQISLDLAINCGLILNELITNAIKHAFKDRREGTVFVSFNKTAEGFLFTVADNGSGLPESVYPGKGSFGMQLLDVFLKQLKASVSIERGQGTKYSITF
ncbi:PAS domain S-box protein [Chryseolinea lacunae]|uniref:histidine kinase n=1 Tax=Chryseolinea lacunae TaxID=2801331 RepID=A0ABS1KNP7_9BACT|nr:PAS domain S-box protein [Chryseolinea lacunae]MBL0741108.1 PAS domain S-box protein [Chryseolinea lacunae]